jgi:hypothetical protein
MLGNAAKGLMTASMRKYPPEDSWGMMSMEITYLFFRAEFDPRRWKRTLPRSWR